ncbi:HBS1-like protein [Dissophora globulifera]|uniref:Elongation factor 1 alpha-like protein n=1 Tax=Dissophora globulifera TaxID=979702 RepID=A0A9P6RZD7_9FUNG|nr:HBS1-like protein [Dissophora globulifera]
MSRHRNVRNLDLDDVLDDGYDEEDYVEEQPMTEDEQAQMADATEEVKAMLGGGKVSIKEIQDALWYYYFDVNQAAVYLIDEMAKKQKTASTAAVKKAATPKATQSGTATPVGSSSKSPSAPSKAKETPKHSAPASSAVIAAMANDDIVEFLDDDDDIPESQLRFDMSAMNFGSSAKKPTASPSKSSGTGAGAKVGSASLSTPRIGASSSTSLLSGAFSDRSGMSSPVGSAPPSGISTPTKASTKLGKRIDVVLEYQKRMAEKESLNLVVIGHVDAGKSTLMGHMLYLQGEVNEKTIRKHERDAQKIGKASFAFAWVLDETGEERARGITMDIGVTKFETTHRRFTLLDAPGHRDFIPNMISGTAQADVAILVVDSTTGEFESGFDANGQTKEHALLARSLGVQQLVVAVNKMDAVGWSEARFEEIVQKLEQFLVKDASFKKSNLIFVPCSGFTGENLVKRSTVGHICNGSAVSDAPVSDSVASVVENFAWYKGPTLLEMIDKLDAPIRAVEKPFRMSVTDVFKGTGGISTAGKLEAGHVQVGEAIMVMPGSEMAVVKTMEVNDEPTRWAAAGDSVLLTLSGIDILQVSNGSVLCARDAPIPVTTHFAAQIVVFDVKIPITVGYPIIMHHQSHNEPGTISKLLATIDKVTGEVVKKNPRHLGKNTTAMVEIKLSGRAIPLETYKDSKELGRVMLRKGGETVAAGIVTKILSFGS